MFNDFQYTCQLCIRILKENMRKSINEEGKTSLLEATILVLLAAKA